MPGPEIQDVYLDALEEHPLEEIGLDAPLGRRPKAKAVGTTVPIDQHRDAFRRKWDTDVQDDEEEEIPPPLVMQREPKPEEIPDDAREAAELLRSRGLPVRFTYSQGGQWRATSRQGMCAGCRKPSSLYVDNGTVRDHNVAASKCAGVGGEPGMMRLVKGEAVTPCPVCDKPIKPTKKGAVPSHSAPVRACSGSSKEPTEVIEPVPVEPVRVLVLRAWPFGVGVWEDGEFAFAYVRDVEHNYAARVKNKTAWGKVLDGASPASVQAKRRAPAVRKASRPRRAVRRAPGIA